MTVVYITKLIFLSEREREKKFSHGPQTKEAEALTSYYCCLQINEKCRTTEKLQTVFNYCYKKKCYYQDEETFIE